MGRHRDGGVGARRPVKLVPTLVADAVCLHHLLKVPIPMDVGQPGGAAGGRRG